MGSPLEIPIVMEDFLHWGLNLDCITDFSAAFGKSLRAVFANIGVQSEAR